MATTRLHRVGGSPDAELAVILDPDVACMSTEEPWVKESCYSDVRRRLETRPPLVPVFYFDRFAQADSNAEYWDQAIERVARETTGHIALLYAKPQSEYPAALASCAAASRVTSVLQAPFSRTNTTMLFAGRPPQLPQVLDAMNLHSLRRLAEPDTAAEVIDRADATVALRTHLTAEHSRLSETADSVDPQTPAGQLLGAVGSTSVLNQRSTPRVTSAAVIAWGNPATCRKLRYTVERSPKGGLESLDPHFGRVPKLMRWQPARARGMDDIAIVRFLGTGPDPDFVEQTLALTQGFNGRGPNVKFERVPVGMPGRAVRLPRRHAAREGQPLRRLSR
ncbi:MAG TPA: hypothetical protein VHU91_05065 [Mycobacteriales bacterium]|jgi:hypothetical protein|nr:hypothetical protein [Mycobacteriales bacterium]